MAGPESVPLSCVQGNTDPAPASELWLLERRITAEVRRCNSGQRLLRELVYAGWRATSLPFPFPWEPWTLVFANSLWGQPGSRGRHQREVALTRERARARTCSHSPKQRHVSPPNGRLEALPKVPAGARGGSKPVGALSTGRRLPWKRGASALPRKPLRMPPPPATAAPLGVNHISSARQLFPPAVPLLQFHKSEILSLLTREGSCPARTHPRPHRAAGRYHPAALGARLLPPASRAPAWGANPSEHPRCGCE